jgi:hypothetical protein
LKGVISFKKYAQATSGSLLLAAETMQAFKLSDRFAYALESVQVPLSLPRSACRGRWLACLRQRRELATPDRHQGSECSYCSGDRCDQTEQPSDDGALGAFEKSVAR